MSEKNSIVEQRPAPTGVIELGTASEQTRGSFSLVLLLDGFLALPYIFRNQY